MIGQIYQGLCPGRPPPRSRVATLRKLLDPRPALLEDRILDSVALILYFPAPETVTGEDVLELHVHGGPAIVKAVLAAIPFCANRSDRQAVSRPYSIRYAEPGEFTKRAFYNGRLDLTQAEALGDSLAAETEQQRRLAVAGAGGSLAARYEGWRRMLLYARGELEALIDFSEDQHFDEKPQELVASISEQVVTLKRQVDVHVKNASKGELLRNGISIALLGAPNVGKSSLLNRIVGREAAIVSTEEGTTRDIVDVSVDIGGWLCRLGDMAGLRNNKGLISVQGAASTTIGDIEEEGMRRARARALESDVVIVVLSLEERKPHPERHPTPVDLGLQVDSEVLDAVTECEKAGRSIVLVLNKIDKIHTATGQIHIDIMKKVHAIFPQIPKDRIFTMSCKPGTSLPPNARDDPPVSGPNLEPDPGNIQSFLYGLTSLFSTLTTASGDPQTASQSYWEQSLSVSHRQSTYLQECLVHLNDFLLQASPFPANAAGGPNDNDVTNETEFEVDIVAAAEHLRFAANCLAKITGKGESGDVEDVLGVVFEK